MKTEKEYLQSIPEIYSQDGTGDDAIVFAHYKHNLSHWYIMEYTKQDSMYFGYACLNGWLDCAELGYISKSELDMNGIKMDLEWEVKSLGESKELLEKEIWQG